MIINGSKEKFAKLLKASIPILNTLPSDSGGEGVAYFLDENFVIKEFINKKDKYLFHAIFRKYVDDLIWANNQDMNMPHIYASLVLEDKTRKWPFRYFILEERFNYDKIYPPFVTEFYANCQNLCSSVDFASVLHDPSLNQKLYEEIVNNYLLAFINSNKQLLDLEEDKVAKFITDIFSYNKNAKVSETDAYVDNVFYDKTGLYLIDPLVSLMREDNPKPSYLTEISIDDIIRLFCVNEIANHPHRQIGNVLSNGEMHFDERLSEENKKLGYEALLRFLKIMNKYCDRPKFSNKTLFEDTKKQLFAVYDKEQANTLIENINHTR